MDKKNYKEEKLHKVRHSLSHLLAAAVLEKWPKAKLAIGPVIDNGFYYDFDFSNNTELRGHNIDQHGQVSISEKDLAELEKRMKELVRQNLDFTKKKITFAQAKKLFAKAPYKIELIKELHQKKSPLSIYETSHRSKSLPAGRQEPNQRKSGLVFSDLCSGPHVDNTKEINPEGFKLTHLAGAYWRGDEKNKMLTRIYGVAFEDKKELEKYLKMMEEAEKRDHRKLGKDLDLFVFSDVVGKGLPLLTPKGSVIRKELEKFVLEEETKRGYQHVITPPLAKVDLYKLSGHYPYYKETMYPVMKIEGEELILRPMTCPHHFMLYKSRPHSYKELPMRIAELSSQFRYEKSGELSGLTRVRTFCLADAHIICAKDQAEKEIKDVLELIDYINKIFGFKKGVDYRYRLSLGDRKDAKKYYKDDKAWDKAEEILRRVLKNIKAPFFEAENEAAFYGPKIDIQMKRVNGQEETAFTVQYDFVMPKRFNLTYIDKDGKEKEAVVIHRSSIGAFERTMALLIEHYAGAFPTWLAPVQVKIIPVSEKHLKYARKIEREMREKEIRVELADANETLGKRIREAELQKIPYVLIVGDKEKQNNSVNVRSYKKGQLGEEKMDKFVGKILKEIESRVS